MQSVRESKGNVLELIDIRLHMHVLCRARVHRKHERHRVRKKLYDDMATHQYTGNDYHASKDFGAQTIARSMAQ